MRPLALLLAASLLAGCTAPVPPAGSPPPAALPATGPGRALSQRFDDGPDLPPGWSADAGTWTISVNASAPSAPNVLRGVGGGGRSTLRSPAAYGDFEANVTFAMVRGDEGAGLSFRYAPSGDYRIVRYSVREDGWHYFVMKGGEATKVNEATVPQEQSRPTYGDWVTLRVRAEGERVQAWHGEVLVIEHRDPGPAEAGAVGPFLRGGAEALFDDLEVRPFG